ncbi:MAG TPA: hypothetical protein VFO89_12210, partial [Thermoanaerobaculia bacterium]|nr:hypothetical protein [Thermoanaerobaculia bacterium]
MYESTTATAASKVVRIGILSPLGKLDPREAVDNISGMILGQIFEAPYAIAAGETRVHPLVFEPLRQESKLEYSAAIRPGVRFSDGTPLTPELAVRSLRGAKVLANKAAIGVREERVWFTLTTPNPRFDLTLTQGNCAI